MNRQLIYTFLFLLIVFGPGLRAQNRNISDKNTESNRLFLNQETLSLKFEYSNRAVKSKSNDSTYIKTELSFKQDDGSWKKLKAKIKKRGKNRLKTCYFCPIKLKIKKSIAKGTLFEGNNKLKLVLPCLLENDANDNILQEYIGYKLYELVSPFHFKTRLVDIEYTEIRGRKPKIHILKGILIEELDNIADRNNGQIIEQDVHPLSQDATTAVQNDLFQYMIGNTDYSVAYQHNQKLLFIDKRIIPVPYDFDMSGLVNASYATVPMTGGYQLQIKSVTQRLFRGFKRNARVYQHIRKQFLDNRAEMLKLVDSYKLSFSDPKEFFWTRSYISEFFKIMTNNQKFDAEVFKKARTK